MIIRTINTLSLTRMAENNISVSVTPENPK